MSRQTHSEPEDGGTDSWLMSATKNTGPGDLVWREQSQATEYGSYAEMASSGRGDQTVSRSSITVNKGARSDTHSRLARSQKGRSRAATRCAVTQKCLV